MVKIRMIKLFQESRRFLSRVFVFTLVKTNFQEFLEDLELQSFLQTKVWLQIKLQEKKTLVEKFSLSFVRKKITLRDEIRLKSFSSFLVQLFIINKEVTACHV